MTKDDIIRMAREADPGFDGGPDADGTMLHSIVGIAAVERFAALVAEQERQDCVRVVMSFKNWSRVDLLPISEAIKSRRLEFRSNE
jgi:hypothetical protein